MKHLKPPRLQDQSVANRDEQSDKENNVGDEKFVQITQIDIIYEDQLCTMMILTDMTAYKTLEAERINNSSLAKTNACLSHEVMGPLQIITQLCEMMKEPSKRNNVKFVNAIQQGV